MAKFTCIDNAINETADNFATRFNRVERTAAHVQETFALLKYWRDEFQATAKQPASAYGPQRFEVHTPAHAATYANSTGADGQAFPKCGAPHSSYERPVPQGGSAMGTASIATASIANAGDTGMGVFQFRWTSSGAATGAESEATAT